MLKTVDFAETETHFPIKHKVLQSSRFQVYPGENDKTMFPIETREGESDAWQKKSRATDYRRNASKIASFSGFNIDNFSKLCQTLCLLEQKVQLACQTCQTCGFRNRGVNWTQIPSLPSLPFSELVPIRHTLRFYFWNRQVYWIHVSIASNHGPEWNFDSRCHMNPLPAFSFFLSGYIATRVSRQTEILVSIPWKTMC